MTNPYLTVIIPTFNRSACLSICLERLFQQNLSGESFEVIVVNDGSDDDTEMVLKKFEGHNNFSHFKQQNQGQGNARNLALKHARGQIVLFIGDDIYPEKDFLKGHADFHIEHPEENFACLGRIEWFPENEINDFMNWLTHGGPQFAFYKLKNGQEVTFWYFYTSNISLKSKLLRHEHFDPDFKSYGWEDIELACRLTKKFNLKIIYLEKILGFHDHIIDEDSLKRRMTSIAKSANIFEKKQAGVKVIPRGLKKLILKSISSFPFILILYLLKSILPPVKKYYWYALSKRYFILGLKKV